MSTKAKESPQIRKARKKLESQFLAANESINDEALTRMRRVISRQLSRHLNERITLKDRNITLFDENQHPAQSQNKFVSRLLTQLKYPTSKKPLHKLEGRIKNVS